MTNSENEQGRLMTVGETAKKMGVTVRALQYYDREGVFSPSALSEGGRRLYTNKDLVQLHRLLSFKSLGFSLSEIKNRLTSLETPAEVADALSGQSEAIREKIVTLERSLKDIEALREEVLKIKQVDFKKYADIIVNLQMKNEAYRLIKYFDDSTLDVIRMRFDRESGLKMMNTFAELSKTAAEYHKTGVPPESEKGQRLAKAFWEMITEFTGGETSLIPKLMSCAKFEEQSGQEEMIAFIEPALGVYFENLGFDPFGKEKK